MHPWGRVPGVAVDRRYFVTAALRGTAPDLRWPGAGAEQFRRMCLMLPGLCIVTGHGCADGSSDPSALQVSLFNHGHPFAMQMVVCYPICGHDWLLKIEHLIFVQGFSKM